MIEPNSRIIQILETASDRKASQVAMLLGANRKLRNSALNGWLKGRAWRNKDCRW
ncbi:MAG: hypothetical protein GWP10_20215 [Nitrospiraceae bacterium]|nr:hypothetical protein [Nitrospiraceae bacterium]